MYPFNYQRAKSVADAAAAVSKNADAKLLAGGQSLIAALKLRLARPSDLIDLARTTNCPASRTTAAV